MRPSIVSTKDETLKIILQNCNSIMMDNVCPKVIHMLLNMYYVENESEHF